PRQELGMGWLWNRSSRRAAVQPRADRHGDPLPPGAVGRLGTNRLQHVVDRGNEGVSSCAFSPDGRSLAVGGRDGRVSIWDCATGRLLHLLGRLEDEAGCLAFSPDGRLLVAGGRGERTWV